MRSVRFLPVMLCAVALLSACPDDDKDGGDGSLQLGGFVDEVLKLQSEKFAQCNVSMASYLSALEINEERGDVKGTLEKAVAAGRLAYNETKAKACVEKIRSATCEQMDMDYAECDEAFEAKVAAGGVCYISEECVNGHCEQGETCPGKCEGYAQDGESCDNGVACGDGLYCDTLVDKKCHAYLAAGADCQSSYQCGEDLTCDENGKCAAEPVETPAKENEACGDVNCDKGLYCEQTDLFSEGTCKKTLGAGAECEAGFFGLMSPCSEGLACAGYSYNMTTQETVKGKCAAWSDVGGACTAMPDGAMGTTGCKLGLICKDSKCAIPPTTGACAANESFECDPRSAYCNESNQCVAKKANGEACEEGEECQSGECVQNKCAAPCAP